MRKLFHTLTSNTFRFRLRPGKKSQARPGGRSGIGNGNSSERTRLRDGPNVSSTTAIWRAHPAAVQIMLCHLEWFSSNTSLALLQRQSRYDPEGQCP
ncbi:hypothetical protein TNCV_2132721 [Trichonephila clavipes]|nr:hypothetical protein TNCV_2132721 [Trichonephila clavipes]